MKPGKVIKITAAEYLGKYCLQISFSDGATRVINFENFLRRSAHCEINKYLNIRMFKKFKLENGDLMWGDFELIFPVADLYNNRLIKSSDAKENAS